MNFRIQEVIKMLIPGTTFLACLYLLLFKLADLELFLKKDYVALYLVVFLVFTYIAGYFIDWFGSVFERFFYLIFSRPSHLLLNDDLEKPSHRVQLTKRDDIVEYLCLKLQKSSQYPFSEENSLKIFKFANYLKDRNTSPAVKERLNEQYFAKVFSRNLMTAFLSTFLCYIFFLISGKIGWAVPRDFDWASMTVVLFFLMSLKRWRENTFYYVRGIFYAAYEDAIKS